tara:strand:+ start:144 stop:653 length:510 start_codon:yes stop_codon:yes gene_type:complete
MNRIIIPNIEYTRELLNSNCDLDFISRCVLLLIPEIVKKVLDKIREDKNKLYEAKSYNDNILNNPRFSNLLTNPRPGMVPITLKEEPTIKKRLLYELKPIESWKYKNVERNHQYDDMLDYESSYQEVISQTIKGLKKIFIDLNIYNETKETNDIHDNITVHNLIIVDWN